MDKPLERLTDISTRLRAKISEGQTANRRWSTWNFWARQQDWYYHWASENALRPSDLRAHIPSDEPVILEQEEGAAYYANRHLIYHEQDMLRVEMSHIMKHLWFTTNDDGAFTYGLDVIARAFDRTENYTHKYIRSQAWYKPRNDIPGSKRWRHLRVAPDLTREKTHQIKGDKL